MAFVCREIKGLLTYLLTTRTHCRISGNAAINAEIIKAPQETIISRIELKGVSKGALGAHAPQGEN